MENETKQDELTILDEILGFVKTHVYLASENQAVAMILYAAGTHALKAFPAYGRMLFTGPPNTGKTTMMNLTAALSANPQNAKGTQDGLMSLMHAATNTPEIDMPTLYRDEVSQVFGQSGLNRPNHIFVDVLLEGYKEGASTSRSVNRAPSKFSLYCPVLMTGRQTAVPDDVRRRCIVIHSAKGRAEHYFDVREAQPLARRYGDDLGKAVKNVFEDLKEFRALGIHPALVDGVLEVWEGLFAVAVHLGGQKWLNKCLAAFTELALGTSNQAVLTARQQLIRDTARLMEDGGPLFLQGEAGFIPAEMLADELKRTKDDLYAPFGPNGLLQFIAQNMAPLPKRQVKGLIKRGCYPIDRMMGYFADDIRAEWDRIRPDDPADVELPEFANPFDISGVDDDEFDELPGTGLEGQEGQEGVVTGTSAQDLSKEEPESSIVTPPCEQDNDPVVRRRRAKLPAVERKFLKEEAYAS